MNQSKFHPSLQVAVALVHYPIVDKAGSKVCTNITNFDVHDIARACRTFGVQKYYLINPLREQLMFAGRMIDHWRTGFAAGYNPMRSEALGMVRLVESLEQARQNWGEQSLVVGTTARDLPIERLNSAQLKHRMLETKRACLLVFGTGFGLHQDVLDQCDLLLEPLKGAAEDDYRHLSVRSAVSIYLDRLLAQ